MLNTALFTQLQDELCAAFAAEDGHTFVTDQWHYAQGGGGVSRILEKGAVFEKAGVNFSHIQGAALPQSASAQHPELAGKAFAALGVSVVMHPQNPYVPTSHANVRCLSVGDRWWIGGGYDLTPYYGFTEDCILWHQAAKKACDSLDTTLYPHFKKACDDYFYLKHRQEARGIGGIFFDDLHAFSLEQSGAFLTSVMRAYLSSYCQIVQKRKAMPYGERERQFQCYRRGRYVEFNLLYDRGTLFGLQSGGRTESILMSLPPAVSWRYDWRPEPGSREAQLYQDFLPAKDWI